MKDQSGHEPFAELGSQFFEVPEIPALDGRGGLDLDRDDSPAGILEQDIDLFLAHRAEVVEASGSSHAAAALLRLEMMEPPSPLDCIISGTQARLSQGRSRRAL